MNTEITKQKTFEDKLKDRIRDGMGEMLMESDKELLEAAAIGGMTRPDD